MQLVDLIVLACTLANAAACHEYHILFQSAGSLRSLHDAGTTLPGAVGRRASELPRGALALRLARPGGRENLTGTLTGGG